MARPPRVEFPGAIYHVTARGNKRRAIFRDDRDRAEYLARLARYRARFHFQLLAFCLMTNHVHLALRTSEQPLSRILACLQSSYAQWFNRRYRRAGHLFEGRYKAFLVQGGRYFAALLRYIHRNPVRAGIVQRSVRYRWSSDRYFRSDRVPMYLDRDAALSLLEPTSGAEKRAYITLMDGVGAPDYEQLNQTANLVKGDERFALSLIQASRRFEPRLRGLSEERVISVVARVTGLSVASLRGPRRGSPLVEARCVAGYVGKKLGSISFGRMARYLSREESYLLKGVAELERRLAPGSPSQREVDEIARHLRKLKSGFQD